MDFVLASYYALYDQWAIEGKYSAFNTHSCRQSNTIPSLYLSLCSPIVLRPIQSRKQISGSWYFFASVTKMTVLRYLFRSMGDCHLAVRELESPRFGSLAHSSCVIHTLCIGDESEEEFLNSAAVWRRYLKTTQRLAAKLFFLVDNKRNWSLCKVIAVNAKLRPSNLNCSSYYQATSCTLPFPIKW